MYFSYVIYSPESGSFYYGYADDLDKAIELHNSGKVALTQGKGQWVLVFSETYNNRLRAIRQVSFYRSVKGQRFLKKTLNF